MPRVLTNPLVKKAARFAKDRHRNQRRISGEPYYIHPQAVARKVARWTQDPNVVAAAYLHDVIEDTGCDYEDIAGRFGKKVARYVALLSRDFRKPKKMSLALFRAQLKKAPPEVKLIEAADIEHNLSSEASPQFMRRYVSKTSETLKFLRIVKPNKYQKTLGWFIKRIKARIKDLRSRG